MCLERDIAQGLCWWGNGSWRYMCLWVESLHLRVLRVLQVDDWTSLDKEYILDIATSIVMLVFILNPRVFTRCDSFIKLSIILRDDSVRTLISTPSASSFTIVNSFFKVLTSSGLAQRSSMAFVATSAVVCIAAALRKSIRVTSLSVSASDPRAESISHCTISGCSFAEVDLRSRMSGSKSLRATENRLRICL